MVRLVFRPYTQVRKAICTSAHLRASTRVSSGFALLRHSSPSFGSQQVCSYSNLSQKIMVGRWCRHRAIPPVRLLALHGCSTHQLAYMLDSLVRVSRRARLKAFRQHPERAVPEGLKERLSSPRAAEPACTIEATFYPAPLTDADQHPAAYRRPNGAISLGAPAASNPFPLNNFKHF